MWQYGLWGFQAGHTKLERFLPKNQQTKEIGELSKIGHYFSNN